MTTLDRVKRLTDLFLEGTEVYLGDDDEGAPVVVWVNKLNSFEDDECRRDGIAARAERQMELSRPENPEAQSSRMAATRLEDDEMVSRIVEQRFDEDYLAAMDDAEMDEDWREKLEYLRRGEQILDDADANEKRRQQYQETSEAWFNYVRALTQKRQDARRDQLAGLDREELIDKLMEEIRNRAAAMAFMEERRVTELYFAVRDCKATRVGHAWDHENCDHRQRLLPSRQAVRELPEVVIDKLVAGLNSITVDRRTAGNGDAPVSSSDSSEQPSKPEDSEPSIPVVTQPESVTT